MPTRQEKNKIPFSSQTQSPDTQGKDSPRVDRAADTKVLGAILRAHP